MDIYKIKLNMVVVLLSALLYSGCGSKEPSLADQDISNLDTSISKGTVLKSSIVKKENIYYLKSSKEKFSGTYVKYEIQNKVVIIRVTCINGLIEGVVNAWYANGKKRGFATYQNGLKEGVTTCYHVNGKLKSTESYANGLLEGKRDVWYDNGTKKDSSFFKHGKLWGKRESWHRNGKRYFVSNIRNGLPYGKITRWHSNGKKFFEGNVDKFGFEGKTTTWHPNGKKSLVLVFSKGQLKGDVASWTKNGELRYDLRYKDGGYYKIYGSKAVPIPRELHGISNRFNNAFIGPCLNYFIISLNE